MAIAMEIDFENIGTRVQAVENAKEVKEVAGALVVNVHANFVIEGADRFTDMVFPHMMQRRAQIKAAEVNGSLMYVPANETPANWSRPFRRPDFADEWKALKKAWSLHNRNREKLAAKVREAASELYYKDEPLKDLPDWVWRFCMFLGATHYQKALLTMHDEIRGVLHDPRIAQLLDEYGKGVGERSRRYFDVLRDYFAGWSEFSQVHFAVAHGMPVAEGHVATTSAFQAVRMFYGNTFEVLASSADLLAFMNNVLSGRHWSQFQQIDAETYLKSDKAKRFDSFADRPAFINLCAERDNQLRNASHHGALKFDSETGLISYHVGKGNTGTLVTMSYADYLSRCSAIFFQTITLLRFELLICNQTKTPYPV